MKIKELKRTVNVSWSPAEHYPVCLAAGSAAQQVDASFSSNSILELYSLNLEDPGLDLEVKASLQTQHKFHKLAWSGANVLVGGCDGGLLEFYSTEKLLNKSPDALLGSTTKHNGQVSSLDVNPYQKNLLASAAAESEIFIWDLNNTSQPMAPGNRSQPFEQVQGLAWNQQVQHILGSTFSTRCVVWDLRKNEPIMKLSDSQTRTRWRALSWHPSVATQLCIASEDDQVPVLQLWDLRLAASPLVTLEGHHKGVMAMSWSSRDPDLLLSGGKDGRVLCWNPNNTKPGGELLSQLSQQPQWVVDLAWCPRVPSVLLTTGETLAVHSLEGGSRPDTNTHNQNSILDSFGGDAFSQLPAVSRAPTQASVTQAQQLPTAPKWYRRATRAKFAFGGKLVSFEKSAQEAGSQKAVYISQVISEPDIVEGAASLDHVLALTARTEPAAADQLAEYCRAKGDASTDQSERYTWFFLRANFLPNFRSEVLNLLGFKQDEIPGKFKPNGVSGEYGELFDNHVEALTKGVAGLSRGESTETDAELSTDTSTDLSDAHTLIERKLSNVDAIPAVKNVTIPNGEDSTSLICRALICGNLEEAVELCLDARKVTDAFIIASLGSQELLSKVQKFYLNSTSSDPISLLSSTLLLSRWDSLVTNSASGSWRQTLAAIITHCEGDVLPRYCEMLGDKLSQEKDPALIEASTICYLCSMSVDSLVRRWQQERKSRDSAAELTALVEKALLAKRAKGHESALATQLETLLEEYGHRLASQGCLQSALHSLQSLDNSRLKQRLMCALRQVGAPRASQAPTLQSRARTVSSHTHAYNDVTNNHHSTPAFDPNSVWQQGSVPAPAPPNFAPARPPSAGPQPGGITSRSKYKVDPSVQSAPLYNQYNFQNPITSQPSAPQPYGGYNSPIQDQYNVTSVPGHNFAPVNTVPLNPVNPANTAVNGSYYNAPQVAQEAQVASKPAAPGWNDPPMMTSKPKPKQEMPAQAPITHPLFGVEPPQHIPLAPVGQYPGQQAQYPGQQAQYPGQQAQYPGQQAQYPGQQAQYPGQQAQYPGQQSYPGQQGYPTTMSPGYTQQKVEEPAPVEKVPVQKAPIPEEHAVLQSVFDALRSECSGRASNAQIKRKLEDVQKRLETLYDLLREYRLSESALSSLHTCASLSSSGDFASALGAASSLATGADFASVASFLPGLKVLLQLATQLQAHAR